MSDISNRIMTHPRLLGFRTSSALRASTTLHFRYRSGHITGGYGATGLADPSPKLPYRATSHTRQTLYVIMKEKCLVVQKNVRLPLLVLIVLFSPFVSCSTVLYGGILGVHLFHNIP